MTVKRLGILPRVRAYISIMAVFALVSVALEAAETNRVDVISLGRLGTGWSNDGWQVSSVTNYSASYSSALRFNIKGSYALSPVFAEPITRIDLQTISSADSLRRLAFTPLAGGIAQTNLTRLCAYSATKNIFVHQSLTWPRSANVRSFRIQLEGNGGTAWGIRSMTILSLDPPRGTYLSLR